MNVVQTFIVQITKFQLNCGTTEKVFSNYSLPLRKMSNMDYTITATTTTTKLRPYSQHFILFVI